MIDPLMDRLHRVAARSALLACLFACTSAPTATADEPDFAKLASEKGETLVSVKFVLKMKGGGGDSENEGEVTGLMIDAGGLVLCSNSQIGGNPAFMRPGSSATPSDIKIFLGADDQEGLEARMVARDSELDLVWFKVKKPGERKFAAVSLDGAEIPAVGDRMYTVVRLGKYFDRAAVVRETRVGGLVRKPRSLIVPSSAIGGLGQPLFDARGRLIGLSVVQLPDAEELQHATSPAAFAGANSMILPAGEIAKATKRALEADSGEESPTTSESKQPE